MEPGRECRMSSVFYVMESYFSALECLTHHFYFRKEDRKKFKLGQAKSVIIKMFPQVYSTFSVMLRFLYGPVWSQELDLMILIGPFHLWVFYVSGLPENFATYSSRT